MKMGEGIRLLYILLDGSGSFAGSEYVADACNSLLEKKRHEAIMVSVSIFGMGNDVYLRHLYAEIPIAKASQIRFAADGTSPIWYAIVRSFEEIRATVAKYPISSVEFVIVSDFFNEEMSHYADKCRAEIKLAQEARWQLTGLAPKKRISDSIERASRVGFPADRIMEV